MGWYSSLAAMRDVDAVAIEPQRKNAECIRMTCALNNWRHIRVVEVALTDHSGRRTLYGRSTFMASLLPGFGGYGRYEQPVWGDTLDRIVAGQSKRLLIKMDVEGAEYEALQGAMKTLHWNPRPIWIVEIFREGMFPGGKNPVFDQTFEIFERLGYKKTQLTDRDYLFE